MTESSLAEVRTLLGGSRAPAPLSPATPPRDRGPSPDLALRIGDRLDDSIAVVVVVVVALGREPLSLSPSLVLILREKVGVGYPRTKCAKKKISFRSDTGGGFCTSDLLLWINSRFLREGSRASSGKEREAEAERGKQKTQAKSEAQPNTSSRRQTQLEQD